MSFKLKLKKSSTEETHGDVSVMGMAPVSNKEKLGLISLEPRILLDAAGFVTGAEVAIDAMVSETAHIGVQAIFDGNDSTSSEMLGFETQNSELLESLSAAIAAAPVDGPWLGQDVAFAPVDGPWLGQDVAFAPVDGPWLGQDVAFAPVDGPWLGQDVAAAPVDGPWLGQDVAFAPVDGPWLGQDPISNAILSGHLTA